MGRILGLAALAVLLAGCGSFARSLPGPPDRLVVGVSVARPAAAGTAEPDAATAKALEFKVVQICTHGSDRIRRDFEPAEQDQQLVDWQFRCRPYRLSLRLPGF